MKELKIKLKKSIIGSSPGQKKVVKALGLTKIGKVKTTVDNASVRGAINKVNHLVEVIK